MTPLSSLEQCQSHLSECLHQHLNQCSDNRLTQAMKHTFLPKSKLLRPTLVAASAMTQYDTKSLPLIEHAATAIELIHVYSLIHDDLPDMDDDHLRRGQPSCHKAFDNATAILAGDALLTMAFSLLSDPKLNQPHVQCQLIQILTRASGHEGMALGQTLDLHCMDEDMPLDQLNHIYHLKTGCLIQAAVEMGLLIAHQNTKDIPPEMLNFAKIFGLAFQIHDDILDIEATPAQIGKPQHSDAQRNKPTYPSLIGLESAKNKLEQLKQQAHDALTRCSGDLNLFYALINQTL
jgi:geranylgeranyl pyrophosphate synthase